MLLLLSLLLHVVLVVVVLVVVKEGGVRRGKDAMQDSVVNNFNEDFRWGK